MSNMSSNVYGINEYVDALNDIIKNKDNGKEYIVSALHVLIDKDHDVSMAKCPTISNEQLQKEIQSLTDDFKAFVEIEDKNLSDVDYDINRRNLAEAITRKFKRKEYFKYFHNMQNISELKEVSLLCFWIIKLKPFTVLPEDSKLRASVNEKFAFNLILSTIKFLLDKKGMDFKKPDQSFTQDVIYSFKYRDFSKESMMMLVDSIAYSYGISIDTWA